MHCSLYIMPRVAAVEHLGHELGHCFHTGVATFLDSVHVDVVPHCKVRICHGIYGPRPSAQRTCSIFSIFSFPRHSLYLSKKLEPI